MMENQVVPASQPTLIVPAADELQQLKTLVENAKSEATRRAYRSDWRLFVVWLSSRHADACLPIPAEHIALYITHLVQQGRRPSTIHRKLAAIAYAHELADVPSLIHSPIVSRASEGMKKTLGVMVHKKAAITVAHLRAMLVAQPDSPAGIRNRALLLVGFAGAFRRSELVALNVEDIEESDEGLTILLRRSKTDQVGAGRYVGIPHGKNIDTNPVRWYQDWLRVSGITTGAIWRHVDKSGIIHPERLTGRAVARIVKKAAQDAGLNPDQFSGHSLRSGFVTSANLFGADITDIMAQTGHKRVDTVIGYVRKGRALGKSNAARKVGL